MGSFVYYYFLSLFFKKKMCWEDKNIITVTLQRIHHIFPDFVYILYKHYTYYQQKKAGDTLSVYCWTMCYNSNDAYADISLNVVIHTGRSRLNYYCKTWHSNPRARGKRGKSLLITDIFSSNLRRQCNARWRRALVKSHNQKIIFWKLALSTTCLKMFGLNVCVKKKKYI